MPSVMEQIFTFVFGKVGNDVVESIARNADRLNDFVYVKLFGLPFIVLGARQTGKTTLIEWMRQNVRRLGTFDPAPTAPGGESVGVFSAQIGEESIRLKPSRDVGGEYEMWETDWTDLFKTTKPRGIIFMIDHIDILHHKDAINFLMNLIEEEPDARRNLKAFMIVVNKSDLWGDQMPLERLMNNYTNEIKRMNNQAARLGYRTWIQSASVREGVGVENALRAFFNAIRPQPKMIA